jgi:hypothetical protein
MQQVAGHGHSYRLAGSLGFGAGPEQPLRLSVFETIE